MEKDKKNPSVQLVQFAVFYKETDSDATSYSITLVSPILYLLDSAGGEVQNIHILFLWINITAKSD